MLKSRFLFYPEQLSAFTELKRQLAQAESLGNFDCNAETEIIADSSPVGLRTVLSQEHKGENPVITYSRRGLSDVERRRRYSQTEKGALGIV